MSRSLNLGSISTRQQRIARLAREDRGRSFLSLAHYIDEYLLQEAYARTRKDGAPGVDGQTGAEYGKDLLENVRSLLGRFKSGHYQAPPVRRRHIPKGDDPRSIRPIGVPTFEDKVLQRAVAMVLEPIYEQDVNGCQKALYPGYFVPFRLSRSSPRAERVALLPELAFDTNSWMREDYRHYFCERCGASTALCSACDRGQRYCGRSCAQLARQEFVRAAGRRYQATPAGRQRHRERQRKYRERLRLQAKDTVAVTHQGSLQRLERPKTPDWNLPYVVCSRCAAHCRPFARPEPFDRGSRRRRRRPSS